MRAAALTSVTLAWDASTSPNVIGYKVYFGTASGVYTDAIEAGTATSVTIPNLQERVRYYFVATSRDNLGQESNFSTETNYVAGGGPGNHAPQISPIADQVVITDTPTPAIPFSVIDQETAASNLVVTGSSDNTAVVAKSGIALSGFDSNRTVTVTSVTGASGSANITLTVSDGVNSTSTSFLLSVTASQPAEPIAAASYNGLFYESDAVEFRSAGSFKLSTTAKSTYSGQLKLQGKTYSVSGKLDTLRRGSNSIPRTDRSPLVFLFDCGTSNDAGVVFGTVSNGRWTAAASGDRLTFNARTNPAPWAGSYTMVLPAQNGAGMPKGHSYGTIKVNTSGAASFAGSLGDGTRITQSASLSKEGMWPFYSPLYAGKGLLMSWLSVTRASANSPDVAGLANWIKLSNPLARYYPAGFTNECNAAGSIYIKPPTNTHHIVHLDAAKMEFVGGNLPVNFTNSVEIGLGSKIINHSTNALVMSFSLTSGTFSGRVLDPGTHSSKSFGGVVLQKFDAGYGSLLGTNLSSQVELAQ